MSPTERLEAILAERHAPPPPPIDPRDIALQQLVELVASVVQEAETTR